MNNQEEILPLEPVPSNTQEVYFFACRGPGGIWFSVGVSGTYSLASEIVRWRSQGYEVKVFRAILPI